MEKRVSPLFFLGPGSVKHLAKTKRKAEKDRIPGTRVDEHMMVERDDGSLWMLLRNTGGIAQSVSTDGG